MNQNLTDHEREFLKKAKYLRRYLSSEIGVSLTPLKDLLHFYEMMAQLYERAGELSDAEECRSLWLDFSETEMYFQIAEEYLEEQEDALNTFQNQAVRVHFNLMEAYIERGEMEKAMEHKKELDKLVTEE